MEENKREELNKEFGIEEKQENMESNENIVCEEKKGNNKLLTIVATSLVGLVLAAVVVLLIVSLSSPKNTFFRLVSSSMSDISKRISGFENSVFGKILAIDTSSKLEMDAVIKGNIKTDDAEMKEWFQNLEDFEVTAYENIDFAEDSTNTSASFSLNGEEFLSGNLIKNKNMVSVSLDNITDGYITVDNNNLSTLWEKIGYNGPSSLDNSADLLKELNFSKKDINNLKNAFSKFGVGFFRAFDDNDFSYGTGVVTYDEGSIDCKSMDLVVNAADLNNGIIEGMEEIISKEKYVDALYKVISTIDKINGYEPFSREEFSVNLEKMLEQIRSLEFTEDDNGFIVRIYYKGNDILKVELRSDDYNTILFELTCVNNKESSYYKFSDGMVVYEDKVTTIDKVISHLLTINYVDYETGEILDGYGSEINITINNTNKNSQSINLTEKVRLISYDTDLENLDIMAITPTVVRDYTLKGNIDGDNNLVDVILIDGDGSYTSTFAVNVAIKETEKFREIFTDDILEHGNFIVSEKTDDEIIAKKDLIVNNWKAHLTGNSNKMQQFEMVVSMYLSMFIPMDYYTYNTTEIG